MGVAGPFDRCVQKHIAFLGELAIVDQVDAQAAGMHKSAGLGLRGKLFRVTQKAQLGIKGFRSGEIRNADADMVEMQRIKAHVHAPD